MLRRGKKTLAGVFVAPLSVPFTPSHAVVALPFVRTPLVPAAIAVGAMAPDLPLFVRGLPAATTRQTHDLAWLPATIAPGARLLLVWRCLLRPAARELVAATGSHRGCPRAWDRGAAGALRDTLGIAAERRPGRRQRWHGSWLGVRAARRLARASASSATSCGICSRTRGGWGVEAIPALDDQWGPLPGYKWLQHGSSVDRARDPRRSGRDLAASNGMPRPPSSGCCRAGCAGSWWLSLPAILVVAWVHGLARLRAARRRFTVAHLGVPRAPARVRAVGSPHARAVHRRAGPCAHPGRQPPASREDESQAACAAPWRSTRATARASSPIWNSWPFSGFVRPMNRRPGADGRDPDARDEGMPARIEHAEVPDQRSESGRVAGRGDDGIRCESAAVDEHDVRPSNRSTAATGDTLPARSAVDQADVDRRGEPRRSGLRDDARARRAGRPYRVRSPRSQRCRSRLTGSTSQAGEYSIGIAISVVGTGPSCRGMIFGGVRTDSRTRAAPFSARSAAISAPVLPAPTTSTSGRRMARGSGTPKRARSAAERLLSRPVRLHGRAVVAGGDDDLPRRHFSVAVSAVQDPPSRSTRRTSVRNRGTIPWCWA